MANNNDEDAPMTGAPSQNFSYKFTMRAELWRVIAYVNFWIMCIFAIIITRTTVIDDLAAGPKVEGSSCGPFNQAVPGPGLGFDFATQGHLVQMFGFSNICANWDYSPSRELTAMVYPIFEYSLMVYICLEKITVQLAYGRGAVGYKFWIFSQIVTPIELVLCAWFRMIFVVIAYENPRGHTAGFLGLQIVLVLVAIENTLYVVSTNQAYKILGGLRNTRIIAFVYIVGNLITSFLKLWSTIYIVATGNAIPWTLGKTAISGYVAGRLLDIVWMIFNAFIPMVIAIVRFRSEGTLSFTIDTIAPEESNNAAEGGDAEEHDAEGGDAEQ